MIKRPLAISIIGCYLVCKRRFAFVLNIVLFEGPGDDGGNGEIRVPLASCPVFSFCRFGDDSRKWNFNIKRDELGRVLYTTWTAIGSVVSFLTVPTRAALVPGILIFLVVVFFLFSEKANHFFKRVSANLMLPNTPLEPTAEKRGGSEAESLCVRPILRRSCEWS